MRPMEHVFESPADSAPPQPAGITAAKGSSRILNSSHHGSQTGTATHGIVAVPSAKRLYRAADNRSVTRDIAALDFLLGIPLEAEAEIIRAGWLLQQQQEEERNDSVSEYSWKEEILEPPGSAKGKWWEKWVKDGDAACESKQIADESKLDQPRPGDDSAAHSPKKALGLVLPSYVPGRRLDGDEAIHVQIPLTTETLTNQKSIARQAAIRDWELKTAHGLKSNLPPLLDGRLFFSCGGSYPISTFSLIRYEPRKEEAALRRQKLEARGGGGTSFVMPARDWRGISYRLLLPRITDKRHKTFSKFSSKPEAFGRLKDDERQGNDNHSSSSSSSSDDSDVYIPGVLDDPEMVLGRHRKVMIGDRVTGPIVSSTIQFVKPALLKAELNKQFKDRFDGWEPPKSARKYIGAKVVDGEYKLMDPAEEYDDRSLDRRNRQNSVTSMASSSEGPADKQIRMPPSLTLSKIRSLKQQALIAAVKANLQVGTVALASVYFERLCLDCRVDKSNRRLSFAACLLLASKLNEPNVGLVMRHEEAPGDNVTTRLKSLVKPNKRSSTMFASLLEFFTQDWSLGLKSIFDAEWGVFAALSFSLHAPPSQVAFHFRRLMKTLERNPRTYLGDTMFDQWQDALADEEERRKERAKRRERRRRKKEGFLLNLHIEMQNDAIRRKEQEDIQERGHEGGKQGPSKPPTSQFKEKATVKKAGIKLFQRLGLRRSISQENVGEPMLSETEHTSKRKVVVGMTLSPSMPLLRPAAPNIPSRNEIIAIDIPHLDEMGLEESSVGSLQSDKGIFV